MFSGALYSSRGTFDRKDGVDMSNFKKSFATMFAAIMMLTGIIILGTSTVAKAVTYPLTQNIDFGADGELTVNLKPTSPTTVKDNENISTGIEIDATGLHKPIDGLYLEIEVNTKQSSTDVNNTNNITPDTYLDNFATPAAATQPIIKREETIVTPDGRTIKRLYLNTIDTTVKLELPYVMSFRYLVTPADFQLKPVVRVYNADGTELANMPDQTYSITYDKPWLMKQVAGEETNDQLLYGGINAPGDSSALSNDKTSDVIFSFRLFQYHRAYRSIIITDTLPTYVNAAGQTVTAHFDPAKNPNWTLSPDGRTVTLKFDIPAGTTVLNDYIRDNLPGYSQLKLSFPGARYLDGTNRVIFNNTATLQGIPYNPSAAEETVGQVPGNEHNFDDDSKQFRLAGNDFSGNGMLSKRGPVTIQYDKNGLAVKKLDYTIKLVNKLDAPLTDIEFIEDVANTDNRLFMTALTGNLIAVGQRVGLSMDQIEVRGYKADGSYDIIPTTKNGANWLYRADMNSASKQQLQSYLDQINQGTLDPSNASAVSPQYKKIGIYFKNVTLQPASNIDFNIQMMFMNPFGEVYSDRPITNIIKVNANKVNTDGTKTPMNFSANWSSRFTPFSEKVWLSKSSWYQRVGMPNERFSARFGFALSELSPARYLKNPTFVDLLPAGVSYDENTSVSVIADSLQPEKVEYIRNYNETGRNAIKITLPSGYVYQYGTMGYEIRNLVINDDIIPSKAENDVLNNNNDVYFYATNWTHGTPDDFSGMYNASNFVRDNLDINMNGVTDETILKATAKVLGNNVESIQSDKHIRSLEPNIAGGGTFYGRAFTSATIMTDFAGVTDTSGLFQYRLSIRNYYNTPMNKILMYDVLPYVGDGRNSAFSNTLQGPIDLRIGSTDVSSQYEIYYRTDEHPAQNDINEINSPEWTKTPADYTKVTAIKIVGKDGTILPPYTVLSAVLTMKAPLYDPNLSEALAYNDMSVIYNNEAAMRRTEKVANQLVDIMDVKVEKKWLDADGNAIAQPDATSITVKLLADGVDTGKTLDLTAANNWTASFTHLRKYTVETHNDGTSTKTPIVYTLEEVGTDANGMVTYNGKKYKVTATSGQADENSPNDSVALSVTNQLQQEKVSVSGKKLWDDSNNNDGKRPASIVVRLLADGVEVQHKTVTAADNWEYTFSDLPKFSGNAEITYTVSEDAVPDYTTSINGFEITNQHAPEALSIPVKKVWVDDNNAQGLRPTSVHVRLYADGTQVDEFDLNAGNNWSHIFNGLPRYTAGHEIEYTVKEDPIAHYTTSYSGSSATELTVTNTIEGKVSVPVTKKWIGAPADSVTIHLLADGVEVQSATLTAADNWQHTFSNLNQYNNGTLINYTITEDAVDGYTTQITGDATNYVVTNTNMKTRNIPVTKVWENKEGDSAEIVLYRDGVEVDRVTITKADDWKHTFSNLEFYDKTDGHEYAYTISETPISGYTTQITGNQDDGFTVTNTAPVVPPTTPPTTPEPKKPGLPYTGDASGIASIVGAAALSLSGLGIALRRKNS